MSRAHGTRFTSLDLVAIFALAASFAATAIAWPSLPARIPIHFGLDGIANGFASRTVGAFLGPTLATGVWLFVRFGTAYLPVGETQAGPGTPRAMAAAACAVSVFMLALHIGTLRAATTGELPPSLLPLAMGGLCLALAVLLPRIRRNAFIGIRTPWALASEENWARTHRVASFSMLAAAVACFSAPWLGARSLGVPIATTSVIFAALVPTVYSAVLAKRAPR